MYSVGDCVKELDQETKDNILDVVKSRNSVVILDMSYHMYRFFHSHKMLSIEFDGFTVPTGHIYGFLRQACTLKRYMDNPAIIIAVDGRDSQRREVSSDYKADRPAREYDIHKDTWNIIDMLSLLDGFYYSYNSKYEADDTIYSLASTMDYLFGKNGIDRTIYIFSSDQDMYVSVTPKVKVIKSLGSKEKILSKAVIFDESKVLEEFGVIPKGVPLFKAFTGDSSDGIKGIFRFPTKFAAEIATNYDLVNEDGCFDWIEFNNRFLNHPDIDKVKGNEGIIDLNLKLTLPKLYPYTLKKPVRDVMKAESIMGFYKMNSYKKEVAIFNGTNVD